jgi:hypothetical protein
MSLLLSQFTVYIILLSKTEGLKLDFPVDLEFLHIGMSNISDTDTLTQSWSLDVTVD